MEWKDMENLTVLKLRDEALKFPEIRSVHQKNKAELMVELAGILGIQKPMSSAIGERTRLVHPARTAGRNPLLRIPRK